MLNKQELKAAQEKQQQAMSKLLTSAYNSYGLSLSMIKMVCESSIPTVQSPKSHWAYWQRMLNVDLYDLVAELGAQIQNRRILSEVLGDGDCE
jgi:hypothetical protein